jgi:carbon storage regulator
MLVLSRKAGESIKIGDEIEVKIVKIRNGRVQIGINCPRSIPVDRSEVLEQKHLFRFQELVQV